MVALVIILELPKTNLSIFLTLKGVDPSVLKYGLFIKRH